MVRIFTVLLVCLSGAWVFPWAVVPLAALGLIGGGFAADRAAYDAVARRHIAGRSGLVTGALLALLWSWVAAADPAIGLTPAPQRAMLAVVLGAAAALASAGLVLIGLDLRRHLRDSG